MARGPLAKKFLQIYDARCLTSVCGTQVTVLQTLNHVALPVSLWLLQGLVQYVWLF